MGHCALKGLNKVKWNRFFYPERKKLLNPIVKPKLVTKKKIKSRLSKHLRGF
jgi:hypothetical protein